MIVTLSGVTGIGKSFFKNLIVEELGFKNMVINTTRQIRANEINGIDKNFLSNEQFEILKKQNKIVVDFEFLGNRYAYNVKDMNSIQNQVTELHYSTIYEFKKNAKNVFSIYILPNDLQRAKAELINRKLLPEVQNARLNEIDEHIKKFHENKNLQKQFDCIFINNYDEQSKLKLLNIIKERLEKTNEKKCNCGKLENEYASK